LLKNFKRYKYKWVIISCIMFKGLHVFLIVLSILFCVMSTQNIDENINQGGFFILFGTLWSALEVQIEGENGWASKLPTTSFFGTHFTWYHAIMNVMIFVLVFKVVSFSWALPFWLASLFLIEDYMWFMINPEYGFEKYSAEYVSWHKWVLKMPLGNWLSFTIMLGASFVTFFRDDDATLFIMDGIITGYLLIATVINIIVMGPVKHNDRTDTSAKIPVSKASILF